ncbi:MAG: YraN family protein [Spirochaetia bacterium]|nr:YraN family protein [Spirochaetia bacterium]
MSINVTENRAVNMLKKDGYVILSRNRRIGGVEIDIMALRKTSSGNVYYLIEVKKILNKNYFMGYPPLSFNQIQRYLHAMNALNVKCGKFLDVRFVLMLYDENNKLVEFIENMPFLNKAS